MGLFSRKKSDAGRDDLMPSTSTVSESTTLTPDNETPEKKSFYRKLKDFKNGPGVAGISDEEFEKATGMTREENAQWAHTAPGVAGGQSAGSLTAGGNSGIGLTGAGEVSLIVHAFAVQADDGLGIRRLGIRSWKRTKRSDSFASNKWSVIWLKHMTCRHITNYFFHISASTCAPICYSVLCS